MLPGWKKIPSYDVDLSLMIDPCVGSSASVPSDAIVAVSAVSSVPGGSVPVDSPGSSSKSHNLVIVS